MQPGLTELYENGGFNSILSSANTSGSELAYIVA